LASRCVGPDGDDEDDPDSNSRCETLCSQNNPPSSAVRRSQRYITPPDLVSEPMASRCRRKNQIPGSLCHASFVIALVVSCGPPLTQPSSQDISGRWTTSDPIGPLSDVQVTITQRPDGTLSGQWSGKVSPADAACPPGLGSDPTGPVNGTNTILEVRLSLLGAGDFDGQAVDSKTLKGSFVSCGNAYAISFSLVGPVPPP
jgi:hypothetical protein